MSAGLLPPPTRPLFEEGLALVLRRWTALSLAVEHGWGGPQSTAKAEELYANLLEWFYTSKGEAGLWTVYCFRLYAKLRNWYFHVQGAAVSPPCLLLPTCLLEWLCTCNGWRRCLLLLHPAKRGPCPW